MERPFPIVIFPGVGIDNILFGARVADVVSKLGSPFAQQVDDDGDEILSYPNLGIALLVFDSAEEMRLTACELSDRSLAELWGYRPFDLSLDAMIDKTNAAGFALEKAASSASGDDEILYRIRSQSLDFYYSAQRLVALAAGVIFDSEETIRWPR